MNKVRIVVYEESYKFINYLVYHSINYSSLNKCDEYYSLIVSYDDYKKINRRYKTNIVNYYGKIGFVNFINYHKYMIISFLFSLFLLYILCNTINEVRVNTDNEEVRNMILNSLKDSGITKNRKKVSFNELKTIKEKILNDNKDYLEWIEIRDNGSIYEVDVTLRVKNNTKNESLFGSIYASKDGLIKHITCENGIRLKDINDYVKKGELLISGNNGLAKGRVYAETWYITKVNIPFKYYTEVNTGEIINHYYLDILGKKFTLIGKYDSESTRNETILVISKPYLFFKLYREKKAKYKKVLLNLSEKEAFDIGINESIKKIDSSLRDGEYIISKKVLKKEVKSSKMYVEVFFKVYENIGYTSNKEKREEKYEISNN